MIVLLGGLYVYLDDIKNLQFNIILWKLISLIPSLQSVFFLQNKEKKEDIYIQ